MLGDERFARADFIPQRIEAAAAIEQEALDRRSFEREAFQQSRGLRERAAIQAQHMRCARAESQPPVGVKRINLRCAQEATLARDSVVGDNLKFQDLGNRREIHHRKITRSPLRDFLSNCLVEMRHGRSITILSSTQQGETPRSEPLLFPIKAGQDASLSCISLTEWISSACNNMHDITTNTPP